METEQYKRRHKQYEKKKNKRPELAAVLNNLDIFLKSLNSGKKPKPFVYGFLHSEPVGIIAIDQKGSGVNIAETRLYVYPDTETETLYLVTLGDKSTQRDDIKDCKTFARNAEATSHTGESHDHDRERDQEGGRGRES